MGRAEDLFARFSPDDHAANEAVIQNLIAEGDSEELFLDYKTSGTPSTNTSLHDRDKKNYAEAISGFGNGAGGLIIWGVNCKSDPIRGDIPDRPAPIANPKRFRSWLEGLTSACTLPPHPTVQSVAIESAANPGEGFIVTYVAGSDIAPHQVALKNESQFKYYMRSGSSFMPIQHGVLAALFGRRPEPKLEVTCLPAYQGTYGVHDKRPYFTLILCLRNSGAGLARYPTLQMEYKRVEDVLTWRSDQYPRHTLNGFSSRLPLQNTRGMERLVFAGGADVVVFPRSSLAVTELIYKCPDWSPSEFLATNIPIDYEIHCEGFSEAGTKLVKPRDFVHFSGSRGVEVEL